MHMSLRLTLATSLATMSAFTCASAANAATISLGLIDVGTSQPIAGNPTLDDNETLYLSSPAFSVRATYPTAVGSITFAVDGTITRTESLAPYSIAGDDVNTGVYTEWVPPLGSHTMVVKAYSGSGATGTLLSTRTLPFKVADSPPATKLQLESFVNAMSRDATTTVDPKDRPDWNLGYNPGDWSGHSVVREQYPPTGWTAGTSWFWISHHGNRTPATRDNPNPSGNGVWVWDIKTWLWETSTGSWRLYESNPAYGSDYKIYVNGTDGSGGYDFQSSKDLMTFAQNQAGAPTSGYAGKVQNIDYNYGFHGFPANRFSYALNNLRGTLTQARMVLATPFGGNGQEPKYVGQVARDWWRSPTATAGGYENNRDGGIGRPRRITTTPRLFAFFHGDDALLTNLPAGFTASQSELADD